MNRVLTVSLGIVAWAMCSNAGLAEQRFDGRWSIEAIPERGPCHRVRRFSVSLENGAVKNAGSRRAGDNIAGGLEPNGRIQGSVQRNRTRVDVNGMLSDQSGTGSWATDGRVKCSGRWTAEKGG